ncbi:Uncharacterised protein [Legionella hackeliae]|uniref:Major outer membrane protein n=2 Tax=Legionella hackeliae TaxID=449 RepID=A0A0A8UZI7_LEGHA|nr:Lpg1974 family pore-forming outer membrane protein [Legionella hackeliae]CEK12154.1 conserved exported protein of unknown function [Legionella hackeliae]STX48941.1 Uncharacterised protein [Legionella hackeliae]
MKISKINRKLFVGLFMANSTVAFSGTVGSSEDVSNHFFFTAAPVYGSLSDEGINKTIYSNIISVNGANNAHQIDPDSRWGYLLGIGYKFGPQQDHDVTLTYTNLKNKGFDTASTPINGVLINELSQIVQVNQFVSPTDLISPGGQQLLNAASAVSSRYDFQTAELLTHRYFPSTFLENVSFSRYYGIKASEFKKGFSAQYNGTMAYMDDAFLTFYTPLSNSINYEAKYYGIGPQIGMGASWSLTRYISIVGDVSASALGGSYRSKWSESLNTAGIIPNYPNIVSTNNFSYTQSTSTTMWTSIVVGSNLAIAAQVPLKNGSIFGIQGGINTEQYWSQVNAEAIHSGVTENHLVFAQRFAVRDVFIKLNYLI